MKFIILSILGVFAFRTSGVSADCCQTSEDCPEGYERFGEALGLTTNGSNIMCKVKSDGTTSSCSNPMAFCSGGDVPTPTASTSAPSTPTPPTSTCCQTSGYCPEGYESIGSIDNNILCGVKIDGTTSCDPFISSGDFSFIRYSHLKGRLVFN